MTLGSDHFPILLEVQLELPNKITDSNRWNLNKANWPLFSEHIDYGTYRKNITYYNEFINELNQAAEYSITKKRESGQPKI